VLLAPEEMKGEYMRSEVCLISIFLSFHQSMTLFNKATGNDVEAPPPRPLKEQYGLEIQER